MTVPNDLSRGAPPVTVSAPRPSPVLDLAGSPAAPKRRATRRRKAGPREIAVFDTAHQLLVRALCQLAPGSPDAAAARAAAEAVRRCAADWSGVPTLWGPRRPSDVGDTPPTHRDRVGPIEQK